MPLPQDQTKRDTIKAYIQEAVQNAKERNLLDIRAKTIFESVKDSEDSTGFTLAEFKDALKAAIDYDKVQTEIDKRQNAVDVVDQLQL